MQSRPPADSNPTQTIPLGYGRRPSSLYRKLLRACIALSVLAAIGFIAQRTILPEMLLLTKKWNMASERQALFEACLNHQYPPGTIIFDEVTDPEPDLKNEERSDTDRIPRPLAGNITRPPRYPARNHDSWYWTLRENDRLSRWNELMHLDQVWSKNFYIAHGLREYRVYTQRGPTWNWDWADEVFVHSRQRPDGTERLVALGFDPGGFIFGETTPFRTVVLTPADWNHALPCTASAKAFGFIFTVPPDQPLKLYAGQADPLDATHFTVEYETPAGKGTVDGYLKDDDSVNLKIRSGPAKQ